ncbi:hypothetical protein [Herbiconiux sp. UC225_62]|uniref:hypothetical protein n=1 Tax=Herbiconiux sp. UC225_62 TaxID=3350168 RepID=UPI0036D2B5DB
MQEAREQGVSPRRMRARDLGTPFRGARVANSSAATHVQRSLAYRAVMPADQCFSHVTAAVIWGCPLPTGIDDGPVHVSSRVGASRVRMRGVAGHELSGKHVRVAQRDGVLVTDPVTTWLQLAGILDHRWLVAAGDHFVLDPIVQDLDDPRPYVGLDEFARRVGEFTGWHCRSARAALARVRPRAESPRETFLRLELVDAGLPEPLTNHPIFDSLGRQIAIGDLVYPDQKVLVEYDGEQHRTDSRQYWRDIERHDDLLAEQWTHIRIGKDSAPEAAVPRTRAALRAAGLRV